MNFNKIKTKLDHLHVVATIVSILPLVEFVRPMTFTLPLSIVEMLEFLCPRSRLPARRQPAAGCARAFLRLLLQLGNGNTIAIGMETELKLLRVCSVRPLFYSLRGSKGGVSSNLIGSNVFGWLLARSYFSRIARGRRGKTGFLQMKPGIVVGMPNQLLSMLWLGLLFERIARGRGKTGYFQMKLH